MSARTARALFVGQLNGIKDRFFSYVDINDDGGCWLWRGHTNPDHGRFWVNGRMVYAHRVSYVLAHGPIPRGRLVLHRCGTQRCVNPTHLYLGDDADNARDRHEHDTLRELGEDLLDWL